MRAPHGQGHLVDITLDQAAFASGSLRLTSYARVGKLITASHNLVTSELALLSPGMFARVVDAVVNLLRTDSGR